MKKLIYGALCLAIVASLGCAITDYPIITDDRGDFSGIIRTGHAAYITPTSAFATIYPDGSDELFTLVYQNSNGDQKLYTKNNFDFSASILFMDQTYCDWRTESCEIARAWNPAQDNIDDPFDYEGAANNIAWPDCSGARSLSLLVSQGSRIGECGDNQFWSEKQDLFAEFSDLSTTAWRGETAYVVPINSSNASVVLTGANGIATSAPVYGNFTAFITEKLQTVVPATPNARHELRWMSNFIAENGNRITASISYGDLSAQVDVGVVTDGIDYNLSRF